MTTTPSHLERATALVPVLAERAVATEQHRRLLPETIADLKAAGLHRMAQPRRFGGAELPLDEIARVIAMLARGCASSAWVAGLFNDHAIVLSKFDPRAAEDVWAETPDALVCASFLPSGTVECVAGGYRIAGTWSFASGCDYADWLLLGSVLPTGEGPPLPSLCLVPRGDLEIEDTWHVLGLVGTGSNTIVVRSALVPAHRTFPLSTISAGQPPGTGDLSPLARLPHGSTVPFLFGATGLGIAESLLALMVEQLGGRASTRGAPLAELQSVQLHIAEAAAEIDCARLLMERDLSAAMAAMRAGHELTLDERARNRRDQAYVGRLCRRAVDRLFSLAGGRGMYLDQVAQRKFRDMCAVSSHISTSWDVAGTTYGRVTLGLDPGSLPI